MMNDEKTTKKYSCEIEGFVETKSLQAVRDTSIARTTGLICLERGDEACMSVIICCLY